MNRKWADEVMMALTVAVGVATTAGSSGCRPAEAPSLAQAVAGKAVTTAQGQDTTPAESNSSTMQSATVAIERAAKANKYVFLFCYRADDEPTRDARTTFDTAMGRLSDRAMAAFVNVVDLEEQAFVNKYGLARSPMPLVLALAPNGAVTKSFVGRVVESQYETAFVSPGSQKCLKALQDRKMVFLCGQNGATLHNAEAMRGVREFAADAQYAKTTEIILIDPVDAAEESFLKQVMVMVDGKTDEAITVFLAPPGTIVATFKGETQKEVLVAAAKKAAAACDPKSGCCPPNKNP